MQNKWSNFFYLARILLSKYFLCQSLPHGAPACPGALDGSDRLKRAEALSPTSNQPLDIKE
jgi:hypothetical protein